ncbi:MULTISPECIES: site-specific integrase [Pseudomonas]|nr:MULTISPECIES: site-specific integrase [Pseudomonas]MDD2122553.1 site-specific integrase [Pseudomonas monteilii]
MKHSADCMKENGRSSSLSNTVTPSLNFPTVAFGERETPWDLTALLYIGGAGAPAREVQTLISSGKLGQPVKQRLSLVTKIHQAINDRLVGGGSKWTAESAITQIRKLFQWADEEARILSLENLQSEFLAWSDFVLYRWQIAKSISQRSAYCNVSAAAYILDSVLERTTPLISITRLRMPSLRPKATSAASEKQSLENTFEFGFFLQDICDALSADIVLKGNLPISIPLRRGGKLLEWSGYPHPKEATYYLSLDPAKLDKIALKARNKSIRNLQAWQSESTQKTRHPLLNRRIEAELLIFISQTGMNLSQAHKLQLKNFYYSSHLDGYQIRDRKARRGGEVLFDIYSEYKPHFERYLAWRKTLFPERKELFPLVRKHGRNFQTKPQFTIRTVCKSIGLKFIPPQTLRHTRVNWLLRRTGNPSVTAEMGQHTKETLLRVYEKPNQQQAITEIVSFWNSFDPTILKKVAVAPGHCNGVPARVDSDVATLKPDCLRPSGCFWCAHHRDIDRMDYLWALTSFRHLKIIELSKWVPPSNNEITHPAKIVIVRISDKLKWFGESSNERSQWLGEALARVEEGNYHPDWRMLIHAMEGQP